MKITKQNKKNITTALLLAAGTGSRLYPLTCEMPKCLTMVAGTSILERLVTSLIQQGFKRLIVVTGHEEQCIRNFLGREYQGLSIEYVFNPYYKTTNNIYSLWMAREIIIESFVLIESDLVFNPFLLEEMCYPDRIAVANIQPWMNGTSITFESSGKVDRFYNNTNNILNKTKYKTVNIYSFSISSWQSIIEVLNDHILKGKVNSYYETVFAEMINGNCLSLQTVLFDNSMWYEIDTVSDLAEAEKLISKEKYKEIKSNCIVASNQEVFKNISNIKSGKESIHLYPNLTKFPPSNIKQKSNL